MGCGYSRISQSVSYSVLRKSLVGALIPEDDYPAFYSLCKTDVHTITSQIFINQGQLFFVVVAGEVVVQLTPSDSRPRIGITHKPGEVIHFFHGSETANTDGTISSGGLKLSLAFTTLTTPAIIIGVDRSSVEDFARARPHLTKLRTLLSLNLANFLTGPNSAHFRALTYKQLNILGPLLKLRLSVEEEHIKFTGKEITLTSSHYSQKQSTSRAGGGPARNRNTVTNTRQRQQETEAMNNHLKSPLRTKQVYSPTYVVLHGLLETIEYNHKDDSIDVSIKPKPVNKIKIAHAILSSLKTPTSNSLKYRKVHTTPSEEENSSSNINSNNITNAQIPFVTIPRSPQSSNRSAGGTATGGGAAAAAAGGPAGKQVTPNSSMSPRHKSHPAGTIIGLEHYLAGKFVEGLPPIRVVGDLAILAHMDLEMLKILTSVDRRLQRVLSRNFIMNLLDSFRDQVPMISDMDEKAYTMLCSTIQLRAFAAGETIYKQGDSSKFAYIIIHGSVVQSTEWACAVNFGPPNSSNANISTTSTINKSASYSPHNPSGSAVVGVAGASGRGSSVNPEAAAAVAAGQFLAAASGAASGGSASAGAGGNRGAASASAAERPVFSEDAPAPSIITDAKVMGVSALFGEVALVTEVPYMTSTAALEPTLLVAISRAAFNEIYNNNKATLAEIRIRMVGHEIGLQAILDHPVGSKLFREFVEENRAAENLQFYTSVDRFDDMCARLKKHMMTLRSTSSMKAHGAGVGVGGAGVSVMSGRISSMFEDGQSVDLRALSKTESLAGEDNPLSFSPRNASNSKMLETINEQQSVASEKTSRLDVASEKRSVMTALLEDDVTLSHKHNRSGGANTNNNSKGPLGRVLSNSLMEEGGDSADLSPATVTGGLAGIGGVASPLSMIMREGSGLSALASGGGGAGLTVASYTSNSAKTIDRESLDATPITAAAAAGAKDTPLMNGSESPSPQQHQAQQLSNKSGVRLAPLLIDPHSNMQTPDFDDVLLDNQDTYLAQGCNSNPASLRISGSTSNHIVPSDKNATAAAAASASGGGGGGSGSTSGVPTPSEVRGAEENNKLMKMKYLKIEKTTAELQEVARTIMERYINEGSPCEVNIPSTMRINTQRIFEDWVNSHQALKQSGEGAAPALVNGASFMSMGVSQKTTTRESDNSVGSGKIKKHVNTPFFQLDFCDMFQDPKQEILKLLKSDLFVRWKRTKDFQAFIATMKPYDDFSIHSNHSRSSRGGSQAGSNRKSSNGAAAGGGGNGGGALSRENSLNKGLRALASGGAHR